MLAGYILSPKILAVYQNVMSAHVKRNSETEVSELLKISWINVTHAFYRYMQFGYFLKSFSIN